MQQTKLILIDGITGSGKSTTAQFLADQLQKNGVNVKWYHEEEYNHPLDYKEDVEIFASKEDMEEFLEITPNIWRKFVKEAMQSDKVHIIESFIFQNTIRLLFQNNLEVNRIIHFAREIEDIIKPLNPAFIYFYQHDVEKSIRRIWNRRGENWKNWFIEFDSQTPFVKECILSGEEGVIKLWTDYQNFTNKLFNEYDMMKLSIENSAGDWKKYRESILNFLDLDLVKKNSKHNLGEMNRFIGTYRERNGEKVCTIKILNGNLVCDLTWPDIRILPMEDSDNKIFYLESFPVQISFSEDEEGFIKGFSSSGGRKSLDGKMFYKIEEKIKPYEGKLC